ncbi:hypothetical protein Tco_0816873 [Tanacetum coccineum]
MLHYWTTYSFPSTNNSMPSDSKVVQLIVILVPWSSITFLFLWCLSKFLGHYLIQKADLRWWCDGLAISLLCICSSMRSVGSEAFDVELWRIIIAGKLVLAIVGVYGPFENDFRKVVEVVIGVVMMNDMLNYEVKMICRILR